MRSIVFLFVGLIFLMPPLASAGELNAGFVQGIWYSSPTVFADTPVRIYVALRNNTDRDLTGTVRFSDNEKRIGTAYVSALPGRIVEAWTDWIPTFGEHTINATLFDVKLNTIGKQAEIVTVESTIAEDTIFVDFDTDRDGIGNKEDTDDDNDTLSDTDEIAAGTDPLVFTKPIVPPKENGGSKNGSASVISATTDSRANNAALLASASSRTEGLERYTDDGTIDGLLSNITEKVTGAKTSLDTYRKKRTDDLKPYFTYSGETATKTRETGSVEISSTTPNIGEQATITRSQIKKTDGGFLHAMFEGGKALVSGFYTLILWIISNILAHPAFVQLGILFTIMYMVYKTARKLGRRPGRP